MKHDIKFRRFMSAGLSAALALSLSVPSFALEGKEVKGEPAVGGDSEVTVQVLCDHGHTHWEDNGDGTHDEICDDCGDVVTDDEPHSDDDGNGVCDKCGENSHQVLIASIPVVLPIMAKVDGNVTVPSNAEIANLTEGRAIRVKDLDVTLSGGWSLVDGDTTFTEADKGSKLLAMGFRGTAVAADGSMDMTQSNWSIAIDGSLPLEMRAAIPAQTQKFAGSSIGKVTFTLDWAEGSTTPDPEPEPEADGTTIDRTAMDGVFGTNGANVKTIRFETGNPANGTDISTRKDRTVLATLDSDAHAGVIYVNDSYLVSTAELFYEYGALTSVDLKNLDTSKVTDMHYMFGACEALTALDLSTLDTSKVTTMRGIFNGCKTLAAVNLSGIDTSKVTDMGFMFAWCSSLTTLDLSGFDTGNATIMRGMFWDCHNLKSLDLSSFNTSKVTDMWNMFAVCQTLTSLDMSGWDTSNVTNMGSMFNVCSALTSLDVSSFDTSNVTDMSQMFSYCGALASLDLSGFDTSNVTDMGSMFDRCSSLTSLDASSFDTSNVTNMYGMFHGCSALTSLNVSGWDTSNVTDMSLMFDGCASLTSLDLSSFDTSNVTDMGAMFYDCSGLTSIYVKDEAAKTKISTRLPSTCTIIVGSPA